MSDATSHHRGPCGGSGTFDVPLEWQEVPGVTAAYWCGISVTDEQWGALASVFGDRVYDGESVTLEDVLAGRGLMRPTDDGY